MGGIIIKYRRLSLCVTTRQSFSQLCVFNLTFALLDNLLIADTVSEIVISLTVGIAYSFFHILNDGAGYWNRTNDWSLENSNFTIKLIPQIWSGGLLCSDNKRGYLLSCYHTPHLNHNTLLMLLCQQLCVVYFEVKGEIRTHGFTALQAVALDHSATLTLYPIIDNSLS